MERQQLLDREASSWEALMGAVARVPEPRRTELGVVPGWSVADLVWHCGYWVDDAARRIELIAAGRPEEVAHDARVIEVYLGTDAHEVQRTVAARPS